MARRSKARPVTAIGFLLLGLVLGWQFGDRLFGAEERRSGSGPAEPAPGRPRASPSPSGSAPAPASGAPEIHAKHFLYGYPTGAPATNDLIVRDAYALSSNDETKLADWVAFRLDRRTVQGDAPQSRQWRADPWLDDAETLEPADYRGAYEALGMDRGHQAPLASFQGTDDWAATNFLSNITPQRADLNQGPWRILEERVRDLTGSFDEVYVVTGPLYEREMPALPGADEPHRVPSGYWTVVIVQPERAPASLRAAAFLMEQDTPRDRDPLDFLTSVREIERRSGLDFLRELPDDLERRVEESADRSWAARNLR